MGRTTEVQRRNAFDYGIGSGAELDFIHDADRLARVERQVFFRDELEAQGYEVPEDAVGWQKATMDDGAVFCEWSHYPETIYTDAPDLLPNEPGPCWRAILNGED